MSDIQFRSYEGTPNYIKGGAASPRKDAVRLTHRKTAKAFREIGDQALNLSDYERTVHLPVGRGRLACDPETGEFDPDAIRSPFNPSLAPAYPRFVHSNITEDESMVVENEVEHQVALASRKWADKPMEKKKRFKLTAEDQMMDFKGQLLAERAGRLQMERRLEEALTGASPAEKEDTSIMGVKMREQEEKMAAQENEINALKARMDQILASIESDSRGKKK